ncbi:ankyrin repeat-containing domain protein [Podospora aff. communis PSN243]|uniref:Ankyrin repeat-containing domain protein n=1 Tax=Podospora aff. communis PSN243 TaxID=3040156 RepID=A0AAV9G9R3_9PEZI|nr:ankyrin repeat-containing domain protein [Podospora aff. communis PSN243]
MEQSPINWEALKPEIWQLYLVENKTLPEVAATIRARHKIRITDDQLEYKFKQWRFRKNLPPKVWKFVAHRISQRKRMGKNHSQVMCSNVLLPAKKVNKAIARYAKAQKESHSPFYFYDTFMAGSYAMASFQEYLRIFFVLNHSEHETGEVRQTTSLREHRDSSKQVLELLLFLLSNNTPGVVYWSQSLDYFTLSLLRQTSVLQSSLREMIASGQSSALALRDHLWAAALRILDTSAVQELLRAGVDTNKPISLKYLAARPPPTFQPSFAPVVTSGIALPLQVAICSRDKPMVDLLVSHGANLAEAVARTSLLEFASFKCPRGPRFSEGFLDQILHHHCEEITPKDWIQATHTFTRGGDVRSVGILMKFCCENMPPDEELQLEALIYAIRNGLDGFVHFFLDNGINVNALTRVNKSPLWEAVYVGRLDICNLLFEHGATAQPDRPDVPCPLQCAAYHGNFEIAQLLLSKGADVNRLHQLETCEVHGSWCVADKMQLGRTALESALYGQQPSMASMLLGVGAKLLGPELRIAIRQRLSSFTNQLLDRGLPCHNLLDDHESALEAAIITNQTAVANAILALRPHLYDPSALCAATHMTIMTGDLLMVELLLRRRSPRNSSSRQHPRRLTMEGTALAIAVYFGQVGVVELFLSHGIKSPICVFPHIMELASPKSIRYCPCEKHNESPVGVWSEEGGWWRNSLNLDSHTKVVSPLEAAVAGGWQPRILECLLTHNPDIAIDKSNLRPAFNMAIRGNHVDTVRRLLEAGVDVNQEAGRDSATELSYVYFQGSSHAYRPNTALQAAVGVGSQELVDLLISYGANVQASAAWYDGATALQLAAMQGLLGIAKTLLNHGASCNEEAAKPRGRTALEGAAEHGRLDMVQLLLSHGVETTGAHRVHFVNAVRLAAQNAHHAVMELLRNLRPWESEDEKLFHDHQNQEPNPSSGAFGRTFETSSPISGPQEMDEGGEALSISQWISSESQPTLSDEGPWQLVEMSDDFDAFAQGLTMDQIEDTEDHASGSSASNGTFDHFGLETPGTEVVSDEATFLCPETTFPTKTSELELGNFFPSFLQEL